MEYTDDPWCQTERFVEIICNIGNYEATPADYEEMDAWIDGNQERMDLFVKAVKDFRSVDLEDGRRRVAEKRRLREQAMNN